MGRSLAILLVDDDALMLETATWTLEDLGHRVTPAEGGQEALDHLGAGLAVDLVVLDQQMPGLTGSATLAQLRVLRPELPVLLASGDPDGTVLAAVAAHPPAAVLTKPFTVGELRERLGSLGL